MLPATQLEAPTRIAFSAPPDRDGRAVLRVSDESGQQLEGLWATIVQDGNETPGGRRTMEVGSELALPPGKWRIDDLRPATPTDARGFGEFLDGIEMAFIVIDHHHLMARLREFPCNAGAKCAQS